MPAYLVPWARRALAGERAGHPRVLVGEVPDGDAHTALHVRARLNDRLVVHLLLREERVRRGERHAYFELRARDLEPERGELLEHGLERAGDLADDEVALEADAVDWHAVRLQLLHEVQHRGRLRACVIGGELKVIGEVTREGGTHRSAR